MIPSFAQGQPKAFARGATKRKHLHAARQNESIFSLSVGFNHDGLPN
jgi:hypothetical protein